MTDKNFPHKKCEDCNEEFDNSFELIDHLLPEDEEFDPYYILPNGFKLLLGSLLRFMYSHSNDPEQIELISQSTYVTLFAAEMGYDMVDELVEDMIVNSVMNNVDDELRELLKGEKDDK